MNEPAPNPLLQTDPDKIAELEKDGKLSSMHVAFVLVMIGFQVAILTMIGWFCLRCISKRKDRKMMLPMYSHM